MKSFLDNLQPVPFDEELNYRCFFMTFTKFWRTFLNSCFKEIANKKTEWKGSQSINSIGISWRGFIHSNVKKVYCFSLSDTGYKK